MDSYLAVMGHLRDALLAADYTVDSVIGAITPTGQAGLERNHTLAADRALAGREDPLSQLTRLFVLQQWVPGSGLRNVVDTAALSALGLLVGSGDGFRAAVDIRPYEDATLGVSGWVASDHAANLDTVNQAPRTDHVLGVSPASVSLSQIVPRRHVAKALDLGTGSGIQSLHLARHSAGVVATDVNPRALTLATLTFALNELSVDTRLGSLYDPVEQDSFDLIATNPPFVIAPDTGSRLVYRETSHRSDDLMRSVVGGAGNRLAPGGSLHVVGNWAHLRDQSWMQRLTQWVPAGCDAFVVERETLDPYEYIEIWLADAGLAGTPQYRARYDQWLTYFDQCGIEAVGMGWITMVKSGSPTPRVLCEHWPHPVTQPVAEDLMAHLAAMDYTSWTDRQFLDHAWLLAPGVVQEALGSPGVEDPAHVVLRRVDGLKRAIEVDSGLGGVLGACDGELPLAAIVSAVAELIGVDVGSLARETLSTVRQLVAHTWLTPCSPGVNQALIAESICREAPSHGHDRDE